jgi:N-acetylmuramoyl-L-alanine amidase
MPWTDVAVLTSSGAHLHRRVLCGGKLATFVVGLGLAVAVCGFGLGVSALGQQPATPPKTTPTIPGAPMPKAFPAAPLPAVQPHFSVVLDAAHGGTDSGARLEEQLQEKEVVLALSVRLRSMLTARGIPVLTTRESDSNVVPLQRAQAANHAVAAACISLHATATGNGVHLFTSSLAPTTLSKFLPWQTAQSAYITQSLRLSSEINSAMAHAEVPVSLGRTSIQPMDNFACPAVAVEIAPLAGVKGGATASLSNAAYQTRIVEAIAAAIQQWREDWRQQP